MEHSLVAMTQPLEVTGRSEADAVGEFSGRVVAMALRGGDPVAEAVPERQGTGEAEGLLGWGVTYFLVCDPNKPAPVWVAKGDVDEHRLAS
jgi:hypothetical protein